MLQKEKLIKRLLPCAAAAVLAAAAGLKLHSINADRMSDDMIKVLPDTSSFSTVSPDREKAADEEEKPENTAAKEKPADRPVPETAYRVADKLTLRRKVISDMDVIYQGDLLTGCEATGLTIMLNWYGYDVDKFTIADEYLPQSELRWESAWDGYWDDKDTSDFGWYWDYAPVAPDYMTTFIGYPYREEHSYGCYAPCLVRTADRYFEAVGSSYRGRDLSGTELRDLFRYVEAGIPVAVIMTPFLEPPENGDSWYAEDTGKIVHWQKGHHCMVLIGYDLDYNCVYTADPANGCLMIYDMDTFEYIYNVKGQSAMYIDTGAVQVPQRMYTVGDYISYAGRTYTDSDGTEELEYTYLSWSSYRVDMIDSDVTKPYRVHLEGMGWVSIDALNENLPYYGDGKSNLAAPAGGTEYSLRNVHSADYLSADKTSVIQISDEDRDAQKFILAFNNDKSGSVKITDKNGYILSAEKKNFGNAVLKNVNDGICTDWVLKKVSEDDNRYVIALKENPYLVLSVNDFAESDEDEDEDEDDWYTDDDSDDEDDTGEDEASEEAAGDSAPDDSSKVFISRYTGSPEQMWCFDF